MGTSQSSIGPGSASSLVPPWADDQPQQNLPTSQPQRFKLFRQSIGSFAANGNRSDLQRALGHYARTSSSGRNVAARRLGSVTQSGGALYGALSGASTTTSDSGVNLASLSGLPCEVAIASIVQALTSTGGDSDKIRVSMQSALAEALDGVEKFDPESITDEVIVNTMISYLSDSIFHQIVMDAGKAWNKADTPLKAIQAENALRELVKVIVDQKLAGKLAGSIRTFTQQQMVQLQRQVVIEVWTDWEAYQ